MTDLTKPESAHPIDEVKHAAAERRTAVLDIIRSAKEELAIALFRCDDFVILDALADAVSRKVKVRALVTPTAKNWDRRLRELETTLESMGAKVKRYSGSLTKYHAKYIVADQQTALIASLNFTRKCFDQTGDFVVTTRDPNVVASLRQLFDHDGGSRGPVDELPPGLSPRLMVGPEHSGRLLEYQNMFLAHDVRSGFPNHASDYTLMRQAALDDKYKQYANNGVVGASSNALFESSTLINRQFLVERWPL